MQYEEPLPRKHRFIYFIGKTILHNSLSLCLGRHVSSVCCRMLWLYLSELRRCFACRLSIRCIRFLPGRICNSAVYKKQSPTKVLPWSCMLHSTAKRQVKRHVWKICSSNSLFVSGWRCKEVSVLRGYFLALMTHLCSRCLSVPAVKHRCLGRAISALHATQSPYQQSVWRRLATQVATILSSGNSLTRWVTKHNVWLGMVLYVLLVNSLSTIQPCLTAIKIIELAQIFSFADFRHQQSISTLIGAISKSILACETIQGNI